MAERISRKVRYRMTRADQAASRIENGNRKRAERARRDAAMTELVKKNGLPYTPAIMSWLSAKLDKPSRLITPEEVQKLVGK